MTSTELTARITAALTAERAAARPQSVWTGNRRILENLAEMAPEVAAAALVNPSDYEGYGDACAFPARALADVQKDLELGDENPFMSVEDWLDEYEAAEEEEE